MRRLLVLAMIGLLGSGTPGLAKPRRVTEPPRYAPPVVSRQALWPGRPLCDDGGYRFRPCDTGSTQP